MALPTPGVVRLRVEQGAHGVADARRGVQVDERRTPRRLRVTVGHPDHDRLVQAEHVPEVVGEVGEHRELGRTGIAEHRRHPALAQHLEHGIADGRHARGPYASEPARGAARCSTFATT
jgi:hypothetical protein